ncbi:phytanoyl-CoA dioxygenase [uncultured Campylobacter sp.]|uniref:phytanoyl-CoA dioxygenase n=1 Tax=uncultured Campylobacter sp. TaxID=218934 RepID=UPI00260FD4B1|nr:phytanoyl-CoA dioxygenase [uncultured Campylobacter sp.]
MRINGKEIFEKGALMCHLSRMASLEYQVNYLVHATAEYYEDPSEMAELLCDECWRALDEKSEFCFLPYEREILKELAELIYKYFKDQSLLEGDTYDYLVYQNKSWIEVRELALKTLHIFGYDLDNFDYD